MSSMFNSKYNPHNPGPTTIEESIPSPLKDVSSKSNTLLKQSKYTTALFQLGSSAVGIKVGEGVVLAVERRLNSTLIVPESIEKIFEVDSHICCAASGVITDARTLIEHARVEALNHRYKNFSCVDILTLNQSQSKLSLKQFQIWP